MLGISQAAFGRGGSGTPSGVRFSSHNKAYRGCAADCLGFSASNGVGNGAVLACLRRGLSEQLIVIWWKPVFNGEVNVNMTDGFTRVQVACLPNGPA